MSQRILQESLTFLRYGSLSFANTLVKKKREFVLSRKVLESGTAIGVLIEEARQGEDRIDFRSKLSIANEEAFKTNFWLSLLRDSEFISEKQAGSLLADCEELQKMLISSLKSTPRAT